MTDLKNRRTRRQDETEEQWRRAKRHVDEQGQIGLQLVTAPIIISERKKKFFSCYSVVI